MSDQSKDRPHRHQTLRAAIDWSYSLLSDEEQTLFARLSVFAGGCTLEAAEDVCDRDGELNLLEGMANLVAANLIRQEGTEEPRFGMLETIKEYAGVRLAEQGEKERISAAHAVYFTAWVEEMEPKLRGADQTLWFDHLERDHDNPRAALRWNLHSKHELGLRLTGAIYLFWDIRGHWSEGRSWCEGVLEAGGGGEQDAHLRVRALYTAGALATRQKDFKRSQDLLGQSLQLRRQLGDIDGIALSLNALGNLAQYQGDYERARELMEVPLMSVKSRSSE